MRPERLIECSGIRRVRRHIALHRWDRASHRSGGGGLRWLLSERGDGAEKEDR